MNPWGVRYYQSIRLLQYAAFEKSDTYSLVIMGRRSCVIGYLISESMYHLDESSSQQKEASRPRKRIGSGLDGSISGDQGRRESEKK